MSQSKVLKRLNRDFEEDSLSILLGKNRIWENWINDDDVEKYIIEENGYKFIAMDHHLALTLYNMYLLDNLRKSPCVEEYLKINFTTELENLKDRIYSLEGIDTGKMVVWCFLKSSILFVKVIKQSNTIEIIKNKGV